MKQTIAVLLTCHNRREKTIAGLKTLFGTLLPENFEIEVFLVDDGSTDGTTTTVKKHFHQVNIIKGDGNLFWNQGMRLAWKSAVKQKLYDFYFWLNDDTLLDKDAISNVLECYNEVMSISGEPAIIVGSCRESSEINSFSYGGRDEFGPVLPNGELQTCKYINGNVVIVPHAIYKSVGIFSDDYTHLFGDHDYGLRTILAGYKCYTTKKYIATCPTNKGIPLWCDPKATLVTRLSLLNSPRGLNIKDYNKYRKKFWGNKWIFFAFKVYLKILFPTFYSKLHLKDGKISTYMPLYLQPTCGNKKNGRQSEE
jgi:GT2 family glycosyltransferase